MVSLIREEDTPIYNLDLVYYEYSSAQKDILFQKLENTKIYTVIRTKKVYEFYILLCKYGFEIVDEGTEYINYDIQNANEPWYIFEIKYVGENKNSQDIYEENMKRLDKLFSMFTQNV